MGGGVFFRHLDEQIFEATEWTRGPWSPRHQHGRPPSALVGGRLAEMVGDGFRVVRIAIEITRPVPIGKLRLERSVRRDGRAVRSVVASLFDEGGKLVMSAEALALAGVELGLDVAPPAMDLRFARGAFGTGDVMAWMRMRLPLLEGAEPWPLERTLTAADSGNGVSQRVSPLEFTFVNPDLTVTLHRPAEGEWIGMAARTDLDAGGTGLADTCLYDTRGPIGRGIQTLIVRRRQ